MAVKNHQQEADRLASLATTHTPASQQAHEEFSQALARAVKHGRVWTPERVRSLWPILAEINSEIDHTEVPEARTRRNRPRA